MQAIILAAGESSRFWPLSEGMHKSMVKVMGKPLIVWTIEEIKSAGISDIIVVQSPDSLIEKELGNGKDIGVEIKYVTQLEAKGMGNAVMQAEKFIKDDFFVLNPNHINAESLMKKMIEKKNEACAESVIIGSKTEEPWNYGILKIDGDKAKGIIEKPEKGKEPSDIRIIGIYLLPKYFFDYHRKVKEHTYSYEDALQLIMENNNARIIMADKDTTTLKYPWDLFGITKEIMDSKLKEQHIAKTAQIGKNVIIEGNVWIGENAKIYENAVIKGPCYIGNNCVVGNSAIVRKYSNLEDDGMVGAHAEVSNTIIQEGTHMHSGFVGNSIIGKNCRIGAGFIVANRRMDRSEIKPMVKGKRVETKLTFLGTIIGHNVHAGISVGVMPGVLIGSNSVIGPQTHVRENVESDTVYYTKFEAVKKKSKE